MTSQHTDSHRQDSCATRKPSLFGPSHYCFEKSRCGALRQRPCTTQGPREVPAHKDRVHTSRGSASRTLTAWLAAKVVRRRADRIGCAALSARSPKRCLDSPLIGGAERRWRCLHACTSPEIRELAWPTSAGLLLRLLSVTELTQGTSPRARTHSRTLQSTSQQLPDLVSIRLVCLVVFHLTSQSLSATGSLLCSLLATFL